MDSLIHTSGHPLDITQAGLGEETPVNDGEDTLTQTPSQNASGTNVVAHIDAPNASTEQERTSSLTAMDVDDMATAENAEERVDQRNTIPIESAQNTDLSAEFEQGSQDQRGETVLLARENDSGDEEEVENDEATEDENDEESELSDGEDLRDDMDFALSSLDFKGTYAIAHTYPHGANPWLTIEGLGSIGLPLGQYDANRIISASRQAPYGHGNSTIVNTEVRNTWEVASNLVSFQNPEWHIFLREKVLAAVRDGLGITADANSLRCQLHKLLLYETGSHFLPHQDTPKEPGMFATIIILLPSFYTGGEVHVSHSTDSKVLNLPLNSFLHTSVLAWYADVTHSIKPVESGYRLALSYNLIHTTSSQPTLSLPVTSNKIAFLRRTLEKWHKGRYEEEDDPNCDLLAFVLNHQYSAVELGRGRNALKGKDAHIMANLLPITEEMDFILLLGSLKYTVSGKSTENRYGYGGYSDPDGDGEREITVSDIVNLGGNLVISQKYTALEEYQIVPKHVFDGDSPDGEEGSGYMGNEEATVDYWYNRTVLILLHRDRQQDFLLSAGGLEYAISQLKKANPLAPTQADRHLVEKALGRLNKYSSMSSECDQLMKIVLCWKEFTLWKTLSDRRMAYYAGADTTPYTEALNVFSFKELQPILEQILASKRQLSQRFEFIYSISAHAHKDISISIWCTTQRFKALETIQHLSVADIPLMMEVARIEGASKTVTSILPSLHKSNISSGVWIALLKAIRQSMEGTNSATTGPAEDWKEFLPQLLNGTASCWMNENSGREITLPRYGSATEDPIVRTSLEVVSLFLSFGHLDLASKILDTLLSTQGIIPDRFKYLYTPFVPLLRQLLAKYGLSILTPPFSNFAQSIIGLYLRDMLGGKGQVIQTVVRKLGCSSGCDDCRALDAFMVSPNREFNLRAIQKRRSHIENQISYGNGKDLVSHHTVSTGSPYLLVVTKRPEVLAASQWPARQGGARVFLRLFGEDDMITQLMGGRMVDVTRAMNGTQAFHWTGPSSSSGGHAVTPIFVTASALVPQSHPVAQPPSSSLPSGSLPPLGTSTQAAAGKKRKRAAGVSQGPVIDLTLDDD